MTTTRRLAAILAADVAGYSAAMERDEEGTAAAVRALRREVIEPKLAEHHGRLIKTTGDGFLAEFASPIAALNCALAIQQRPDESGGLRLRIGLNLGDVIIEEGGDVLGEGVNVAARLEGLAEPGGILDLKQDLQRGGRQGRGGVRGSRRAAGKEHLEACAGLRGANGRSVERAVSLVHDPASRCRCPTSRPLPCCRSRT